VDAAFPHFVSLLAWSPGVADLTAPFTGASELLPSQIKGTSFTLKAKRAVGRKPKMCGFSVMQQV